MSDQNRHDRKSGQQASGFCLNPAALSDDDIYQAMKSIPGYLDITTNDFKEIYLLAYEQAQQRILSVSAKQFMSTRVFSARPKTLLAEVARTLADNNISGLPVVNGQMRVVGVISEKDFLRSMTATRGTSFMELIAECIGVRGCPALSIQGHTAGDIMRAPALTVGPETSLIRVSELFKLHSINRAPVVDRENRLLGILTRDDIVRALLP
ncbi:MAG: CBS domain-containing protein [Thermodesulfobacteriota bacterium]